VLLFPIAIAGAAVALHRTRLRTPAQVAASYILLVAIVLAFAVAGLTSVLYLPATVLLLVSGLHEQANGAGRPNPTTRQP